MAQDDSTLDFDYAFTEATKQLMQNNLKPAAMLYGQCIRIDPSSAASYFQLSKIYQAVGDLPGGKEYGKKAWLLDDSNIWYYYNLANLYRNLKNIDSTIVVYEKLVEKFDVAITDYYTLANLHLLNGNHKECKRMLERLINEYSYSEEFAISMHQVYVKEKKHKKAEEELLKLIRFDSSEVKYYGLLVEFYAQINEMQKAEQLYNKMIMKFGNNASVLLSGAYFYYDINKKDKAFELFNEIISERLISNDQLVELVLDLVANANDYVLANKEVVFEQLESIYKKDTLNVRYNAILADINIRLDSLSTAKFYLNNLVELEPENFVFTEQLLYVNNILESFDEMYNIATNALVEFKDQPTVYMFKGLAELERKDYSDAVKSFKGALDLVESNNKINIQLYTFLADAYRNLGNHKESDACFEKVLAIEPDNMMVLNNYAYYLSLRGDNLERAKKMSARTIKKEPDNPTYLDTYAWILYKRNEFKDALKYIEKAITFIEEDNAEVLGHYGHILSALGHSEKSKQVFDRVKLLENK
ncbi:MAG: tetratricopeptide repeat protein [Bacteroidales bacterium]|nr:tetratricopeptide repeat protein [Bacteroidales bacterium]